MAICRIIKEGNNGFWHPTVLSITQIIAGRIWHSPLARKVAGRHYANFPSEALGHDYSPIV